MRVVCESDASGPVDTCYFNINDMYAAWPKSRLCYRYMDIGSLIERLRCCTNIVLYVVSPPMDLEGTVTGPNANSHMGLMLFKLLGV
jgi:hypothetical protein